MTRKLLEIPFHDRLMAILDAAERHDAVTILATTYGRPWTQSGFNSVWGPALPKAISEAGMVFHGMRKSAVVTLLEAGCTDAEVPAIMGQSRQMVEHYSKQVNQRRLTSSAMQKWRQNENGNRT